MRYITALIIGLTIWVIGLAPVWGEEAPEFPFYNMPEVVDLAESPPRVRPCEGVTLNVYVIGDEWLIFSDESTKFVGAYYPSESNHPSHIYYGHIEQGRLIPSITAPFDHDKHITPCQWWAEVPA